MVLPSRLTFEEIKEISNLKFQKKEVNAEVPEMHCTEKEKKIRPHFADLSWVVSYSWRKMEISQLSLLKAKFEFFFLLQHARCRKTRSAKK